MEPLILDRLTPGKKSTIKEKLWELGELQGCAASSGSEEQWKEGMDPGCWPLCPGGHVTDTACCEIFICKAGSELDVMNTKVSWDSV